MFSTIDDTVAVIDLLQAAIRQRYPHICNILTQYREPIDRWRFVVRTADGAYGFLLPAHLVETRDLYGLTALIWEILDDRYPAS